MSRRTTTASLAVALCLLAAGCGGSSHHGSATTAPDRPDTASSPGAAGAQSSNAAARAPGADSTAPSAAVRSAAARAARRLAAGVVATVAGQSITLAAYRSAYAASLRSLTSGGVPLDPPDFSRCAAGLARLYAHVPSLPGRHKLSKPHVPAHAELVTQCRERLNALHQAALTQLIQQDWTQDEAKAEGITVSASQVDNMLAREEKALGGAAAYRRYLARAGQTAAQARQNLLLDLENQQLEQRRLGPAANITSAQVAAFFAAHHAEFVLPGHPHPQLATYAARIRLVLAEQARSERAAAATTAFERSWRARTICAPGYVVPLCANAG
jgi:hypothetical protein